MKKNEKTRVLIVDDDVGMTETMPDILSDIGYDVSVARNGYEAIEMVRKGAYDVTLMDIKMPGINGVEAFKEIKQISPTTKVIMMTAYSVDTLIKEALDEGAYDVIHKPLDIDKVMDSIEKSTEGSLILVVDDDQDICFTLKDVLEENGYSTGVAHSGKEAIDQAKNKEYDIIFIDLKMPVLNGLETYQKIREINANIVAVMMTGYRGEMAEQVEEAMKNNAYTCVYKPLDIKGILDIVAEIDRKKREGTLEKQ
ncbi:MAG: response regulator [Deltaproteobacteria bacterium]|nr:response regulator [Deltaproteobacteria bacterium]